MHQQMSQQSWREPSTSSPEMDQCIQNCLDCYQQCLRTLTHCLDKGGKHAQSEHIKGLELCAEICRTSAEFMLLNSDLHAKVCSACAEVCERCAESCEAMATDKQADKQMEQCAAACRKCSESCRRMAAH